MRPANCLDRWVARGRGAQTALVYEGEEGDVRTYTFDELRALVCRIGNALRALGVTKGDAVGIYLPLLPETAASLLAIGYIGAIAVPAFSGYGEQALAARLGGLGRKSADHRRRVHAARQARCDEEDGRPRGGAGAVGAKRAGLPPLGQRGRRCAPAAITSGTKWSTRSRIDCALRTHRCQRSVHGALYLREHRETQRRGARARAASCSSAMIDQHLCFDSSRASGCCGSPTWAG